MNRRMPNGMYGGVRGERKSPLLDCDTPVGRPTCLHERAYDGEDCKKSCKKIKKISTQVLTVLTICVILQIEQRKREKERFPSSENNTSVFPKCYNKLHDVSFERRYDLC